MMKAHDRLYPNFDFKNNLGYETEEHLKELSEHGPTKRFHFLNNEAVKKYIRKENEK